MKLEAIWGGIGAGAAILVAAGVATVFRVYGDDETAMPLAEVSPDKRFPQYIQTNKGHWLFWRKWTVPEPKAVVFLAHGFAEHCGRYEHVAQYLMSQNINVYAVDHQGHGQSTGTFTYFQRFIHIVEDFLFFIETIVSRMSDVEKKLPRFLLGHSMGGAVAAHTAMLSKMQFAGVILSAPMLAGDPSVATPSRVKMAKLTSKLLPKLPIGKLEINTICSDSTVVKLASADRLYSELPMVARVANEFLEEIDFLQSSASEISYRYYILVGSDDKIASVEGITLWHNQTRSVDKTLTVYPGLFHEAFYERESEAVLDSVGKWIRDRLH